MVWLAKIYRNREVEEVTGGSRSVITLKVVPVSPTSALFLRGAIAANKLWKGRKKAQRSFLPGAEH